ncbi:hypothetical protein M0R45_026820 [Rubus argutus]|uniref:Uncharacterized protein n=1 Tax=Rubus argutus TaxID=59490 RepID=A0AAW1WZY9_RUBAR
MAKATEWKTSAASGMADLHWIHVGIDDRLFWWRRGKGRRRGFIGRELGEGWPGFAAWHGGSDGVIWVLFEVDRGGAEGLG